MSIQPGIGYDIVSTPEGESLVINFPNAGDQVGQPSNLEQFQLVMDGNKLRVVGGTVLWAPHKFNDPDNPSPSLCANQTAIMNYTRYTGDTVQVGTDATSIFMSEGGTVTLSP
jgi:hypothetical protein